MRWNLLFAPFVLMDLISSISFAQEAQTSLIKSCERNSLTTLFVLRQDFNDLPILGCVSTEQLATAVGANASYQNDFLHGSTSFGVNGLAALDFRYHPSDDKTFRALSFGPYVQGNGMRTLETASSPASSVGSASGGLFVELAIEPIQSFIRVHGGEGTDTFGVRYGTAVAEFIPAFSVNSILPSFLMLRQDVLLGGNQQDIITGLFYSLTPEVEVQYDSYQSGPLTYRLFKGGEDAVRIGPLLVFKLYGFDQPFSLSSPAVKKVLQQTAMSFTYHTDWDAISGRHYSNVQTALIFNIVPSGDYAITTAYSFGNSEASGNDNKQVKVAFSAKF